MLILRYSSDGAFTAIIMKTIGYGHDKKVRLSDNG